MGTIIPVIALVPAAVVCRTVVAEVAGSVVPEAALVSGLVVPEVID